MPPRERLGTNVMAQIATLRCLGTSEGKIQKMYHAPHGRHLSKPAVERTARKAGKLCRPPHDKLWKGIPDMTTLNGDETGQFKDDIRCWIWVFVTAFVTFYRITPSRSKPVAKATPERFDGTAESDSYSTRNDAGSDHQKCPPHCFRDLYRTLDRNNADEFKAPLDEMHGMLKGATGPAAEHPEGRGPTATRLDYSKHFTGSTCYGSIPLARHRF